MFGTTRAPGHSLRRWEVALITLRVQLESLRETPGKRIRAQGTQHKEELALRCDSKYPPKLSTATTGALDVAIIDETLGLAPAVLHWDEAIDELLRLRECG